MAHSMDVDLQEPRGTKRTADEAGLPHEAPGRIKPLDQDVINKIAAGEIIVTPMHALKELLENAVDAGSTSIEVLVKDGGLKLLQISDNGHGIDRDDLPILCERYTTSKLKAFEDLTSIGTYGFRGEALASISHIAHLRVTTKTAGSSCAWQAHYTDGKLTPAKPNQSPDPKACAGRPGTQITVEDLFYNVPARRRAFRSPSEEYARILDVVSRYAVHCDGVAFSIKKYGESGAGLSVPSSATTTDRIRHIYGSAVGNELIDFSTDDPKWGFRASGYTSNANYHVKRSTILLFINHRLVESSAVKKAVEQTYAIFLPKGGHPFVYLSLEIDPARVDVNVHPTKREVHFLNEDEIIDLACNEIREKLAKVDTSRTFLAQTLLQDIPPMAPAKTRNPSARNPVYDAESNPKTPALGAKRNENALIRTDSKLRKITSMLPSTLTYNTSVDTASSDIHYSTTDREPTTIRLTSIKTLRAAVRERMHHKLTSTLASLTYIGAVSLSRRICALQSGVQLLLVDYGLLANAFFYQVGLTDFGNFGRVVLDPPLDLKSLLRIAAEATRETEAPELDIEHLVEMVLQKLVSRRQMLAEYFSLDLSDDEEDPKLSTIPLLIKGYLPSLGKLPRFLLRLGPFVDWSDEQACFETFLIELAAFYVPERLPEPKKSKGSSTKVPEEADDGTGADVDGDSGEENVAMEMKLNARRAELTHELEHVLFPAFRARLVATEELLGGVVEVANLKGLYRVFERC